DPGVRNGKATGATDDTGTDDGRSTVVAGDPKPAVLDVLPDDERRILEPVLESPGITQIALRDRSDFSKSKVSQTVSDLEKRGLLYREKQGRTFRVYPDDDLANGTQNAPDA
ncbi:MAG TPA: MarR family transcriptional regulator, partial [Natrialbaceae archaeon]|nr:MarR family transcriptional regulator [Natrialbaceae archaeon]